MSLINEALKKAQHQRTGNPGDLPPIPGGSKRASSEGNSSGVPKGTLGLIIAGAAGAVIIAVIVTVVLLRRPSTPTPAPAVVVKTPPAPQPAPVVQPVSAPKAVATAPVAESTPVIVAPVVTAPKVEPKVEAPSPTVTISIPTPKPAEPVAVAVTPTPAPAPIVAATPAPPQQTGSPLSTSMSAAGPAKVIGAGTKDIRILTLIDSLRVTGIRASGADSKVLMNDRVYRVNDMVDYTLNVKLTRVAAEGLSFVDGNGTVYVKNF